MDSVKRSNIVDIYKGIGIVLVLMGHIGFGDISSYIAHAFHMPMFFFISGFLYNDKKEINIKKWICHKSKGLLYPYLIFGVINYIAWVLIQGLRKEEITLSPIGHLFFVNTTGLASGSLWFLTALWIANVLFYIVNCVFKKVWMKHLSIIIISLLGIVTATYLPFRLPYAMDAGMVGTGMMYVGYLMHRGMKRKPINRIFNLSVVELIVCVFFFSISILLNGEINMRKGLYHNSLLFWINAIAGSVLIYNISMHLSKWERKTIFLKKGVKIVEGIGKNSLIYVCTNDRIAAETKNLLKFIFVGESKIITIFVHVATLVITIGIIDLIIHYLPIVTWLDRLKRMHITKGEK